MKNREGNDGKKEEKESEETEKELSYKRKKRKEIHGETKQNQRRRKVSMLLPSLLLSLSLSLPSFHLSAREKERKTFFLSHSLLLPRANTPRGFFSLSSSFLKVCFVTIFSVFQFSSLKNSQQVLMMM